MTCACPAHTDAYSCWAYRYRLLSVSDVRDDGGPCECDCHPWDEDDDYDLGDDGWDNSFDGCAWGSTITFPMTATFGVPRTFGRSSRAKRRRTRRRADIQLARRAIRRGICPCSVHKIEDPGPDHLPTCRYRDAFGDQGGGECPF